MPSRRKDLLFECDARASALRVSLVGQEAKYSGTIQIDAAVGDGALRETCLCVALPQSGRVDRVLVQFFPRREPAPRWTMGSEELSARKWSDREQTTAGWDASLETWELTLRRPRSTPFEITAVREVSAAEAAPASAGGGEPLVLTLASLPEATQSDGNPGRAQRRPAGHSHRQSALKPIPPDRSRRTARRPCRAPFATIRRRQVAQGAAAALRVFRKAGRLAGLGVELSSAIVVSSATADPAPGDLRSAKRRPPAARANVSAGRCPRRHPRCLDRRRPRRVAMDGNRGGRPADGGPAGRPEVSPRGDRMDGFGATAGNRRFVGPAAAGARPARAGTALDGLAAARLSER